MVRIIGLTVLLPALLLSLVVQAQPQTADTPYPRMAPLDRKCQRKHTVDGLSPRPARLRHFITKFTGGATPNFANIPIQPFVKQLSFRADY